MNEKDKDRLKTLAATDPGKLLYEVYRDGPFAHLDCALFIAGHYRLKRTWAVDPAYDGIKVIFNLSASGNQASLRRALHAFLKENRWTKNVNVRTAAGQTVQVQELDLERLTPASLLKAMHEAIRLTRALSKRQKALNYRDVIKSPLEQCNDCEQVIIPLLQKMPPDKSAAQYAAEKAPREITKPRL